MEKKTKGTDLPKNWIIEQYENNTDITEEMKEKMTEYLLSLHGIKENSKSLYVLKAKMLGIFLTERGLNRFEEAKELDLNLFLSHFNNENTLNQYIYVFKQLYKFLNLPDVVHRLRYYKIELEQITPSETLTPQEIIAIAEEASKKRELYKVVILALFESCARISELLRLKLGDIIFDSVSSSSK